MRCNNENGNVIIEASIVMTITVVMVAVLINLGFTIYSRNVMRTIAYDTAVDVANVYANASRDPMYGYIEASNLKQTELYRGLTNLFTSTYDEVAERKAKWYGLYSLKRKSLTEFEASDIEVSVVRKPGTLIQRQIVVTITTEFSAPLATIWGGDNKSEYAVQGRADCLDLIDYFNTIGLVKDEIISRVDKFLDHFDKIIGLFDSEWIEG